jgi:uncharacterized membrane protein YeaQ/YmgE (transglycosylase-associated protein family)
LYGIAWIVLGLAAGLLASRFGNKGSNEIIVYPLIGVAGAAIGGYGFEMLATSPPTAFISFWSLLLSLVGAVTLLVAYHAVRTRLFKA